MCGIVGSLLAGCLSAPAQETGAWRASSSTAQSITGDIAVSDAKLFINFTAFPAARIRALEPGEVSAVFDADSSAGARGNLYRLNIPGSKNFCTTTHCVGLRILSGWPLTSKGIRCMLHSFPDKRCRCLRGTRYRIQPTCVAHFPMRDERSQARVTEIPSFS